MIGRISLSRENACLSMRLQDLPHQPDRLQRDRGESVRLEGEIKQGLQESSKKIDLLVDLLQTRLAR